MMKAGTKMKINYTVEEWEKFLKSKECDEQFIELLKQFGLINSEDEEADYRRRLKLEEEKEHEI